MTLCGMFRRKGLPVFNKILYNISIIKIEINISHKKIINLKVTVSNLAKFYIFKITFYNAFT